MFPILSEWGTEGKKNALSLAQDVLAALPQNCQTTRSSYVRSD